MSRHAAGWEAAGAAFPTNNSTSTILFFIVITVVKLMAALGGLLFHYARLAEGGNYSPDTRMPLMFSFQFCSF